MRWCDLSDLVHLSSSSVSPSRRFSFWFPYQAGPSSLLFCFFHSLISTFSSTHFIIHTLSVILAFCFFPSFSPWRETEENELSWEDLMREKNKREKGVCVSLSERINELKWASPSPRSSQCCGRSVVVCVSGTSLVTDWGLLSNGLDSHWCQWWGEQNVRILIWILCLIKDVSRSFVRCRGIDERAFSSNPMGLCQFNYWFFPSDRETVALPPLLLHYFCLPQWWCFDACIREEVPLRWRRQCMSWEHDSSSLTSHIG